MYNKDLFEKICNVTCSFDELNNFSIVIDKKEFDLDNPFEKYYSIDRIFAAIEKYESKKVDEKFLSHWMNAYNWIIMSRFKDTQDDDAISLKDFLIWEISDWLDGLSFFDGSNDYTLEYYKTAFNVLDMLLQDVKDCDAVFAEWGWNDDDVVVLVINYITKYFVKVYGNLDHTNDTVLFKKVEGDYLLEKVKYLQSSGFQEFQYGYWIDDDED